MTKKGFTIVEVMVVVAVVTIIFGAFFTVLLANQRAWHSGETQLHLHQQVRQGMQKMLRELRQAVFSQIVISDGTGTNNTDIVTFQVSTNTITYLIEELASGEDLLVLREVKNGNKTVLANDVIDLQFVTTNHLVDVTLTTSRQSTFQDTLTNTLHSLVRPRN